MKIISDNRNIIVSDQGCLVTPQIIHIVIYKGEKLMKKFHTTLVLRHSTEFYVYLPEADCHVLDTVYNKIGVLRH